MAWPYANGPFHIGHLAGAYLPGDAFARFHRLRGHEVLMVSGSDMHGTPILVKAEEEGTTPEAIARRYDAVNRAAFERLGFSFDRFSDTHTLLHERTVHEIFLRLLERGYLDRRTADAAFCPKHARFLPDRYVLGTCPNCGYPEARGDECENCGRAFEATELTSPRCRLCGTPAEFRPSEHFYLRLDKLTPEIDAFLAGGTRFRPSVAHAARRVQEAGLHPTPITRDLEWGISIPLDGYEGKRLYVWFEALIGYLSASREWAVRSGRPNAWERYWAPRERARHYYFIGKDNIFHHTILLPGLLAGAGELPLPFDVAANEWMVLGGKKIAKSSGGAVGASIPELLDRYAPDRIRFYAALLAPQNHDTEFDPAEFDRVGEEVLTNQYGNFAQRLLVLARDREGGRVPRPPEGYDPNAPGAIGARVAEAHSAITAEFEAVRLKEALDRTLTAIREENRRFHEAAPWRSDEADRRKAIFEGLWALEAAAVWLAPFLPFSSAELFKALGRSDAPGNGDWERVLRPPEPGRALGEPKPLFPRAPPAPKAPASAAPASSVPSDSVPLEIRVARIVRAENHPSADRLLALSVDAGEDGPRSVVAGLRGHYDPAALEGRRIALLANLAPRRIRSIESIGMVLATESGGRPVLLRPPEGAPVGAVTDGTARDAPTIPIESFAAVPLKVGRVTASDDGGSTIDLGGGAVRVEDRCPVGELVVVRLSPSDATPPRVVRFGEFGALTASEPVEPGAKVR